MSYNSERYMDERLKVYEVWFSNVNYEPQLVSIAAKNQDDALILAKAERIKNDLDHTLFKIDEERK
jgi:hypothetical protein